MKQKKWIYGGIGIALVVVICITCYFVFRQRIVFKVNETVIEYGSKFSYEQCIEKLVPNDLKVEYPNLEIKEVGTYEVTFRYGTKKADQKSKHTIIVKDTKKPNIKLQHKKEIEIHQNDSYDILENIKAVTDIEKTALSNMQVYDEKEYESQLKQFKKENKILHERIITKQEDIKSNDLKGDLIMATSNLDVSKLGSYEVKVAAIDSNFNVTEVKWNINVVKADKLLNTGGKVVCQYPNDTIPETEAITSQYMEQFQYDEKEMVTFASLITTMSFKENYDQDSNIQKLLTSLHDTYDRYNDVEGVTVRIDQNGSSITTTIDVDFTIYDEKEDLIKIIKDKKIGNISIEETLKNMKRNNIQCVIH